MRRILICAVLGATGLVAQSADAALLSDLVGKTYNPDDSTTFIQVGDKIFTNFNYSHIGDMPEANLVNVTPQIDLVDGNPNAWGVRFQGPFQDYSGGGASDALITYTILVNDSFQAISGAHIAANILVIGGGAGTITETFLPDEASALVRVYNIAGESIDLVDDTSFLPNTYKVINVQKDILFDADGGQNGQPTFQFEGGPGLVHMSFVDQTFYQVPEPASLGILGLAGTALLFRRRKA